MSENKIDLNTMAAAQIEQPARRKMLLGLASVAAVAEITGLRAATLAKPVAAAPSPPSPVMDSAELAQFMQLSRTLTARADLSDVTGRRIQQALVAADSTLPTQLAQLYALQRPGQSAAALLQAARPAGLDRLVHAIVAAWFTGTVGADEHGVVVAYAEALMYRTVSDGLIVPTYGNYGPLWWIGQPPALGMSVLAAKAKEQA